MVPPKKKIPLHTKILWSLLAGAVLGIACQFMASKSPDFAGKLSWFIEHVAGPGGNIFLALIFMIVVPLLLSALILGVGEIGDVAKFGRMGVRTLIMTLIFSTIAVLLAWAAVNLVRPGDYVTKAQRDDIFAAYQEKAMEKLNLSKAEMEEDRKLREQALGSADDESDTPVDDPSYVSEGTKDAIASATKPADPPVIGLVPKNPLLEATRALSGGILPFMFFALFFGIALAKSDAAVTATLRQFFEGLFEVSQTVINMAMQFAPIGVFCLMFKTGAELGFSIFSILLIYASLVLVVLAIHQFGVYSLLLTVIARRNPLTFFKQMRNVMQTAFATSSSNATLPVALHDATEKIGLPKVVSSFVLTVGATANQNGTALFEGITLIFLCQLFDVGLSTGQQFQVLGLSILAGIGTAGVPGGSLPTIGAIIKGFGVPSSAIGLILGVDRILDMSRTVLNVTGDMAIACCVARWEGHSPEDVPESAMG